MSRVRVWLPWTLLGALTAVAAASAVVGVTTEHAEQARREIISPFFTPAGSLQPSTPTNDGYFRGVENFCAAAPLTGTIRYNGMSAGITGVLKVSVGGLPPNEKVLVNWSNNGIRVPAIAGFQADSQGHSLQSSVNVYRLGEVRGVAIILSSESAPNPELGRLDPC